MQNSKQKRIILFLSSFPELSETFIVSKFLGLLERGWDVHILCNHFNPNAWQQFPDLNQSVKIKNRVHRTWPIQPRWLVSLLILPALFLSLVCRPRAAFHYIWLGRKRLGWGVFKQLYLDLSLLLLSPDIVHFEFGTLGVSKAHLKELLNCKKSVSFRGYDLNFVALDQPNYYDPLWRNLDGCHVLSEHLWARAKQRGCPQEMYHRLIPPAVDLGAFPYPEKNKEEAIDSSPRPIRILSVGRLAKEEQLIPNSTEIIPIILKRF